MRHDLYANGFAVAARELARRVDLRAIEWRHHGLGMLQGELAEDIRIHLFHPILRTIPEDSFRAVHDHRFDLLSCVVFGMLSDVPHDVTFEAGDLIDGREGVYRADDGLKLPPRWHLTTAWEIKHSKVQDGNDTTSLGIVAVRPRTEVTMMNGGVYSIPKKTFHTTRLHDFTMTVVNRSNFGDDPARVLGGKLAHRGAQWGDEKSAIERNTPRETINFVLDHALAAQQWLAAKQRGLKP